jgi:hypothetical protein
VPRLQPQAHKWRPSGRGWAPIMRGRSGWYAVGAKGESRIFSSIAITDRRMSWI